MADKSCSHCAERGCQRDVRNTERVPHNGAAGAAGICARRAWCASAWGHWAVLTTEPLERPACLVFPQAGTHAALIQSQLRPSARAAQRRSQDCHLLEPPHHSLPPHPDHHVSPEPLGRPLEPSHHSPEPLGRPLGRSLGRSPSAKGPKPRSAFLLLRLSCATSERCRVPEERVVGPGRILMCSCMGQWTSVPQCDSKDMMDARKLVRHALRTVPGHTKQQSLSRTFGEESGWERGGEESG